MDLYEWKVKNATARKYAHFDEKVSLDKVWNYISNPDNIMKHGFYPFIHYEKKFNKKSPGTYVILHILIDIYIHTMGIF